MIPTVFLFDIDGTLITSGGAGRRAMKRGFSSIYGRPEVLDFPLDGMTDHLILRKALTAIGEAVTLDAIERVLEAYVEALKEEVLLVPDERYRVHRGMREAVELSVKRGVAVGLGTGNVRAGADVKLGRVKLHESFRFGGFGSDAEDRTELIRIGAERGAAELGVARAECRVVVIGDTPRDVDAAKGIGAESVCVATGSFTVDALLASGATAAFADLGADGALSALFPTD